MEKENKQDLINLSEIIFLAFDREKIEEKLIELRAVELYNTIKIDKVVKNSRAIDLINGELFVNTNSSSTMQFIQLNSYKILKAINKKLGMSLIKSIRLNIGNIENKDAIKKNKEENFNINDIKLSDSELKKIDNIVNNIGDSNVLEIRELKNKLRNYFINSLKLKKSLKNS